MQAEGRSSRDSRGCRDRVLLAASTAGSSRVALATAHKHQPRHDHRTGRGRAGARKISQMKKNGPSGPSRTVVPRRRDPSAFSGSREIPLAKWTRVLARGERASIAGGTCVATSKRAPGLSASFIFFACGLAHNCAQSMICSPCPSRPARASPRVERSVRSVPDVGPLPGGEGLFQQPCRRVSIARRRPASASPSTAVHLEARLRRAERE